MAAFRAYRDVTTGSAEVPVHAPGDEWTFDDLYRSQYARMVALARLMTGAFALAEEIVQDAFVQLYRNWPSVEHPLAYVRIAVVNGCRLHGRRRALERRHQSSAHEPAVLDTVAIAVRDALQVLTPRQRAAIVLRYFEDLPEREIAAALGCRPGTVKSLLSRSITKLKGSLHD
jgi:RNA polymerase sigma-70 factor (sigma-E family)